MAPTNEHELFFLGNGIDGDAVLRHVKNIIKERRTQRAKDLMRELRTPEAIEEAKQDCGLSLLQATVPQAIDALKARNQTAAGRAVRAEVMAHIPAVREYIKARLANGSTRTSKALNSFLDTLTDEELADLYLARVTSFAIFFLTTPDEVRDFCKRHPELDGCRMQANGSYIVISFWNDENQVETMTWYLGAAPKQTIAQRQRYYTTRFDGMEAGQTAELIGQRNLFHEGVHDHSHLALTTMDGPRGSTGWLRILLTAFTGQSFDEYSDDLLQYLMTSFDEGIGAAVLNTVYGGYPGIRPLHGARFGQRRIEPGNTQVPYLSDYQGQAASSSSIRQPSPKKRKSASTSAPRPAKRTASEPLRVSTSANINSSSDVQGDAASRATSCPEATSGASSTGTATAATTALAPATTRASASAIIGNGAAVRAAAVPIFDWIRFVVPASDSAGSENADDDFAIVSVSRKDEGDERRTAETVATLGPAEHDFIAGAVASLTSPGWPGTVVNGRIDVMIGGKALSLGQECLAGLQDDVSQAAAFPDGQRVYINVRKLSQNFSCQPLAAPSAACWLLNRYAVIINGPTRRRYHPLGVAVDAQWAGLLRLLAEVMMLRGGVTRGERLVYVYTPQMGGDEVLWDFAARLRDGGARLVSRTAADGSAFIELPLSSVMAEYFGVTEDEVGGFWRAKVHSAAEMDIVLQVKRDEHGQYAELCCSLLARGKTTPVVEWQSAEGVLPATAQNFFVNVARRSNGMARKDFVGIGR